MNSSWFHQESAGMDMNSSCLPWLFEAGNVCYTVGNVAVCWSGLCSCGVGDAHVHGGPGWNVARLAGLFLNTGRKDTVSVIIILLTVSINTKTTHPPVCLILTSAYRFCPPSSPLCPVLFPAYSPCQSNHLSNHLSIIHDSAYSTWQPITPVYL